MKEWSERKSLDFLEKEGFYVVKRSFLRTKFGLRKALLKVCFPYVLKVSGKNVISGKDVSKLIFDLNTFSNSLRGFKDLIKIKGSDGVFVKKRVFGKEFFLTVKKDLEGKKFLSFGVVGVNDQNQKVIISKSFPVDKKKIKFLFKEAKISKMLSSSERKHLEEFILKICGFFKGNKKIFEIKVDSLVVSSENPVVVNCKIFVG